MTEWKKTTKNDGKPTETASKAGDNNQMAMKAMALISYLESILQSSSSWASSMDSSVLRSSLLRAPR